MRRNPFTVLGVPLDASLETIKAAWRRLAREHHPDLANGDAGERRANRVMAEINAAYHELRDPERRRVHRADAVRQARAAGEPVPGDGAEASWPAPSAATGSWAGRSRATRPVTARIDTSALLRPRNATLIQLDRSPLPGLAPRPRTASGREAPRASTPSGPTHRRPGPNFEADLPSLAAALDHPLRFGKFAGLTLGDVASLEPSYVDWIVRTIADPGVNLAARVVLRHLEGSAVARRHRLDTPVPPR